MVLMMRCSILLRPILLGSFLLDHRSTGCAIHGAIKASVAVAFKTFDSPFVNGVDY
jgi:hypothetical protein